MLRDRIMMGATISSLPLGYTKIEYLESDGSAGIDTGYKPTEKTRLEFKASVDSNLFIACDVTNASARYGVYFTNNKVDMGFGASGYKGGVISSISYPCEAVFENGKLTINDTTYTFATQSAFTSPSNLFIFGEDASTISKGKIYYLKILENGVLIRNYIPCTNPNGVRGLYDIVTDQFYILGLLQGNVVSLVESTFTDDNGQLWYVIRAMAQYPVTSDLEITITNATGETTYLHIDKGYVFSKNEGSSTIYSKFSIAAFSPEQDGTYKYVPLLDYTRLDFIETDGTTYIDTGFVPDNNSSIIMDAVPLSTEVNSVSGFFFGSSTPDHLSGMELYAYGDEIIYIWGNQIFDGVPVSAEDRIYASIEKNNVSINKNGEEVVNHQFTASTFTSTTTLKLFSLSRSESYLGLVRLYSCKIYDNGTLVRDFIPAMNASGEAGLYDLKNDVWYALLPVAKPKVENKISVYVEGPIRNRSYGFEFQFPSASQITVTYRGWEAFRDSEYEYFADSVIAKGVTQTSTIETMSSSGSPIDGTWMVWGRSIEAIIAISPTEDDTYIYTF